MISLLVKGCVVFTANFTQSQVLTHSALRQLRFGQLRFALLRLRQLRLGQVGFGQLRFRWFRYRNCDLDKWYFDNYDLDNTITHISIVQISIVQSSIALISIVSEPLIQSLHLKRKSHVVTVKNPSMREQVFHWLPHPKIQKGGYFPPVFQLNKIFQLFFSH